jgi:hypothetical protein
MCVSACASHRFRFSLLRHLAAALHGTISGVAIIGFPRRLWEVPVRGLPEQATTCVYVCIGPLSGVSGRACYAAATGDSAQRTP